MTGTEYLKALIKAAGGDPDTLPDNLNSTLLKCLIECINDGGGSGGGGSSGEYTQPDWGYKEGEVLPETDITVALNEDFGMVMAFIDGTAFTTIPTQGNEYTVIYNGQRYKCTYNQGIMGNGAIGGGEDTGEPFAMAFEGGICMLVPVDQQEGTVKLSILGKVKKAIDAEYAPELPFIDLIAAGLPTVDASKSFVSCGVTEDLTKLAQLGMKRGAAQVLIKLTADIGSPTNGGYLPYTDVEILLTVQMGVAKAQRFGETLLDSDDIYGSCIFGDSIIYFHFHPISVNVSVKKIADFS